MQRSARPLTVRGQTTPVHGTTHSDPWHNMSRPHPTTAEVRIDIFNLFNRAHFANPATPFGTSTFGTISATRLTPREAQLGFRLLF
jgi:hypothetical protein